MVIDAHTHFMNGNYKEHKIRLLSAMEQYKISRIYVSGLRGTPNPDEEQIREDNAEVARFVKEYPREVGGLAYVSPEHPNAVEVVRRGIEDQGFEGVKLWMSTLCDDPRVDPVVEQCIRYGVPILVHAFHKAVGQLPNESLGSHVKTLALRYPEAKLIMAHLGGNAYYSLPSIQDCKNVWVDASGSIYRGDDLAYAYEMLGAERIIFGSDLPGAGSYLLCYGQVTGLRISLAEKELILFKNAQSLFCNAVSGERRLAAV